VVSTGTEILQGLYADTNAQFIAEQLTSLGIQVVGIYAAPDDRAVLESTFRHVASTCNLVICSGGLGPTEDDINRDVFAAIWKTELHRDERALEMMRTRFLTRARGPMPESNEVQALVPTESTVLYNQWGTAPGFYLPARDGMPALVALPGPPKEMRPMFLESAKPLLENLAGGETISITRTVHTYGQPESYVNECCRNLFRADPRVALTILAKTYGVDLRIHASGPSNAAAQQLVRQYEEDIRSRLSPDEVYGADEQMLHDAVAELLIANRLTVAAAESCTGGLVSKLLTDVPGSSAYIKQGYVVYANEAKISVLGVCAETIDQHGAVSEQTAAEMAAGVRELAGSDFGIGVTGIAGPTGGTPDKPVGLTYIAIADKHRTRVQRSQFLGDREMNRIWAAQTALYLLRRRLLRWNASAAESE
jgi:nicotinamide-nucleotide amidase